MVRLSRGTVKQMQATTKKLLLLVLRDKSSRELFEFLYILPTLCVSVCMCVCV